MVRDLIASIYLFFFRVIFNLFKLFPQSDKTTFVSSFGDNVFYVAIELGKQRKDEKIVILKEPNCPYDFSHLDFDYKSYRFESFHLLDFIISIYHLATSKVVFVDNYFGFLSVIKFKDNVKCIQLWHAAGAIKKFGLKDPSIKNRSNIAINRFKRVYEQFDYVTVGSEKMADIFQQSFGLKSENMVRTGIPRTDFFFNVEKQYEVEKNLYERYPIPRDKRVILYAPTYRDSQLKGFQIHLNLDKLYEKLHEEYVLLLKLHPAVQAQIQNKYPDFIIDVSDYHEINHLFILSDFLITDYSSIPIEYSLLEKPIIYFAYDLEEYAQTRGFWEDFKKSAPGPIVKTTDEIIDVIKENKFNLNKVQAFSKVWNEYSDGHSSKNVIEAIYPKDE